MPEPTAARLTMTADPAGTPEHHGDAAQLATPIPTDPAAFVDYLRNVPTRDRARVVDLLAAQYRTQGHPDPLPLTMANSDYDRAVVEIGDEPDTTEPIPTDVQGLFEYLRTMNGWQQSAVADRLAIQLGGTPEAIDRAADLMTRALSLVAQEILILELRQHLADTLAAAADTIKDGLNTIDRLASEDVYDVEFAEGGWDMRGFLSDAGRFISAASALNPAPPTKNEPGQ
ncbi:hypothetical protein AB0A95_30700 [Micromonospora sp. NPDC049230]|uniref:hypothetical protein n=1 Tax=Micromonospora sp. NPDC049230 TaxID=3155502 RepID=UPI0033E1D08E